MGQTLEYNQFESIQDGRHFQAAFEAGKPLSGLWTAMAVV